jgi:hypothetical protein
VDYDFFINKMSQSLATVIISDPIYKKYGSLTQRIYESIIAGCVVFIDESCDETKRIYGKTSDMSDFLYVKDKFQVARRIHRLRTDPTFKFEVLRFIHDKTLEFKDLDSFIDEKLNVFEHEIIKQFYNK